MQIGPGADHHGIDCRIANKILPFVEDSRNSIFPRDRGRRRGPAIANRHDRDFNLRAETRNVTEPGIGAGPDQTDTKLLRWHFFNPAGDGAASSFFYNAKLPQRQSTRSHLFTWASGASIRSACQETNRRRGGVL